MQTKCQNMVVFQNQKFKGKTTTYLQILNSKTIFFYFFYTISNFAQKCGGGADILLKMCRNNIWTITCPKMGLVCKVKSAFSLLKKHQNLVWSWKGEPPEVYPPPFLFRMTNWPLFHFSFIALDIKPCGLGSRIRDMGA